MAFSVRKGGSVVAGLTVCLAAGMTMPAQAQNKYWADDGGTNLLKLEPARRFMLRFGYTYIEPNDKSGDAVDASGPVLGYLPDYSAQVNPALNFVIYNGVRSGLQLDYQAANGASTTPPAEFGLGIPTGVRNDAKGAGSPTVSLLTYLDEAHSWAIEGFLLAIPFKNDVYGAGRIGADSSFPDTTLTTASGSVTIAGSVPLGKVATTQQLPATLILHRFFGSKNNKIRFSAGLGISYAIFFDSHVTPALEEYTGGPTKIKIKNSFGAGPFLGLTYAMNERWSLNAQVGYVKLKTTAKLTTRVDPDILARSPAVLQSAATIGTNTATAVLLGESTFSGGLSILLPQVASLGCTSTTTLTNCLLRDLARIKTGNPRDLGTYVRKLETNLDPWVFNVSVGYSF